MRKFNIPTNNFRVATARNQNGIIILPASTLAIHYTLNNNAKGDGEGLIKTIFNLLKHSCKRTIRFTN